MMKNATFTLTLAVLALSLGAAPASAQVPTIYTSNTIDYWSGNRTIVSSARTYTYYWGDDLTLQTEATLYFPNTWPPSSPISGSRSDRQDARVDLNASATGPGSYSLQAQHSYMYQGMSGSLGSSSSQVTVPGSTDPPHIFSTYVTGSPYPGGSGTVEIFGMNLRTCWGSTDAAISPPVNASARWGFCENTSVVDVDYSIPSNAPMGQYTLTLATPYGWDSAPFTVGEWPVPPSIGGINVIGPTSPGDSGWIEIYGYNLSKFAGSTSVSIPDLTTVVTYSDPNNPYQVNIWYSIPANATPGARALAVTTPYGTGYWNSFTVTP